MVPPNAQSERNLKGHKLFFFKKKKKKKKATKKKSLTAQDLHLSHPMARKKHLEEVDW